MEQSSGETSGLGSALASSANSNPEEQPIIGSQLSATVDICSEQSGLVGRIHDILRGQDCSSYTFLADVIPDQSPEDAYRLAEESVAETSGRKIVIIGYHPTSIACNVHGAECDFGRRADPRPECSFTTQGHTHFYHSCPYTGSYCRCRFLRGVHVVRRRRPTRRCCEVSIEYIIRILQYLQRDERYLVSIQGRGTRYFKNAGRGDQGIREWIKICSSRSPGSLETGQLPIGVCDEQSATELDSTSEQPSQNHQKRRHSQKSGSDLPTNHGHKKIRRKGGVPYLERGDVNHERCEAEVELENTVDKSYLRKLKIIHVLKKKILEFHCVPLVNCVQTSEWKKHRLLSSYLTSSPEMKSAISQAQEQFVNFDIPSFIDYYLSMTNWPLFQALEKPSDLYYDYPTSVALLEKILKTQFDDVYVVARQFHEIFDKRTMKLNTILLYGPPGSGKNFIMDPFINFFTSVGFINTLNKTNLFGLMDLVNKRVGLANDISISSDELEYMKVICGGNQATVRVKFEPDGVVNRTPLVFLSNHRAFFPLHEEAWQQRIFALGTQHISKLKKLTKLIYPLAVIGLWEKYGIIGSETHFVFENEF
jgi:Parvovirus non-structural protein NS1